ncbi:MAG TPA: peptidylprolyl isomerase [Candidatus Binataceae bacterium]|nr:peptidylprolyl isomerase [Candidatus Binataceae bacterium]
MRKSKARTALLAVALTLTLGVACKSGAADQAKLDGVAVRNTGQYAILDTDRGDIVIELYPNVAPKTVANFEELSKKGFYNGLTFHRVEPGFVVQGGDPQGNGMGGPGYDLPAEISPTEKHLRGTVAMARKGDQVNPDRKSSGSQFYICLAPAPFLDQQYTIFGGVVEGMNVVDQIKVGDHIKKVTISDKLPS